MDLLCFCSVLCLLCLCARLFICALWSPAGKGLTSWLSFVVSSVSLSLPIGILDQVWYLIVSIPDLCILTYFHRRRSHCVVSLSKIPNRFLVLIQPREPRLDMTKNVHWDVKI